MGIRTKNLEHVILRLRHIKTLSATLNVDMATIPFNGRISNVTGTIVTPGTGATNNVLDINYLGTTIFATSTKLTLAATTGVATASAVSTVSVTAGAYFTLDLDSVATNAVLCEALITISRTGGASETNETDQDLVR